MVVLVVAVSFVGAPEKAVAEHNFRGAEDEGKRRRLLAVVLDGLIEGDLVGLSNKKTWIIEEGTCSRSMCRDSCRYCFLSSGAFRFHLAPNSIFVLPPVPSCAGDV